MESFASGLTELGRTIGEVNVVRFEFAYMARRREDGRRRPPSPARTLLSEYRSVVADLRTQLPGRRLVIGGKSLGGRMASMIADELNVDGLVCLGYPFHPAGKPERLRIDHLTSLQTPTLFCQGSRDTLGNREDVAGYPLDPRIRFCWLDDGDHSFKPRKASGFTLAQHYRAAQESMIQFMAAL